MLQANVHPKDVHHCQIHLPENRMQNGESKTEVLLYRVHVFNPHGVDWTIKDDPLEGWGGVTDSRSDEGGGQPILPLTGQGVVLPIQFAHRNTLGVQRVAQHWLKRLIFLVLLMQMIHCTLQHSTSSRCGVKPSLPR